jgi:YfiR/HmsC-like
VITSAFRGYRFGVGEVVLIRASSICRRTVALVFVITTCAVSRNAQAQVLNEYEAKAGFLFNFVKFVEWPSKAFADGSSPLIIGVVGDDRSSAVIGQIINGKTANGRRLVVKRFANFKALTYCHIVFVRSSERDRIQQTLTAAGPGALTIGETEGFANVGGIINLTILDNKLRFQINPAAAEKAGLRISAKLLSLAQVIRN